MNTLKAEKRDMTIKAKKLRREGFVTGCIFGRELTESIPLQMEKASIERLLKTEGKGGQVMLEVDGKTYDALIKEIDFNPLKGTIDEVDFQALVSEVSFKALPSALVDKIQIDIGDMKPGDTLKVKDLDIAKDKDVDLLTDPEDVVVTITEVHAAAAEDADEEEEAAE